MNNSILKKSRGFWNGADPVERTKQIMEKSIKARKIYKMSHGEVRERLKALNIDKPENKIFGVPRGGMCLCNYIEEAELVLYPEQADFILDDIIDSGATKEKFSKYKKPFLAIVDKTKEGKYTSKFFNEMDHVLDDHELGWVAFPWENETSPEDAVERIIQYLGEDVSRQGLIDTPRRVLKALAEMTSGYDQSATELLQTTFESDHDQMIISKGIRFTSLCEHHILPFVGTVAVAYIPKKGKVVGLSKLSRVVQVFAKRLQIQERMTSQIAEAIQEALDCLGTGVIVKAHHSCMGCRGANQPDSEMITSELLGVFRKPEVRSEFMKLSGMGE